MVVDRAAHRRAVDHTRTAHAIAVRRGSVLAGDDGVRLLAPGSWSADAMVAYLGHDGERDYVAVRDDGDEAHADGTWTPARTLIGALEASSGAHRLRDRDLLLTATALDQWHDAHLHCPRCASSTTVTSGGWVRRCESCERDLYPRTDPAVIVAITDGEDRMVLAHASYWSARRYSHLAGYVEPGESFEQAVHREVGEESGLTLTGLEYVSSQPWPFPASVMVGFRARAIDADFTLDDDEISDAMWVARGQLEELVDSGDVILAPRGSIARSMLDDWHGDGARLTRLQRD